MIERPKHLSAQRGIALLVVLFLVVVIVLVAAAVLTSARFSANDTWSVQTKNQTFDAAEAGVNYAQYQVDVNQSIGNTSGTGPQTVNGYTYNWAVVDNNLNGSSGTTVQDKNPLYGSVPVGPNQALLAGWASSITGGRTVYVEEIVQAGPPTYLTQGAIVCGKTGTISHQQITDTSGNHRANVICGTLVKSGGGQEPDGYSYAVGTINEIRGWVDGIAHTNATPPTFLTAGQLGSIQRKTLQTAQSGGSNYYTAGNVTNGTIGSNGATCVAYIGGNITLNGSNNLTNYCQTTVVMGNVTISGNATYQSLPASTTHMIYVFGTGGTTLQGTPTTLGIFYVANADVTINGGGNGSFNGAVITPNNVTMNGGGTAAFNYDSTQTPPPVAATNVIPMSQWDY
jgi:hypothetical protein